MNFGDYIECVDSKGRKVKGILLIEYKKHLYIYIISPEDYNGASWKSFGVEKRGLYISRSQVTTHYPCRHEKYVVTTPSSHVTYTMSNNKTKNYYKSEKQVGYVVSEMRKDGTVPVNYVAVLRRNASSQSVGIAVSEYDVEYSKLLRSAYCKAEIAHLNPYIRY